MAENGIKANGPFSPLLIGRQRQGQRQIQRQLLGQRERQRQNLVMVVHTGTSVFLGIASTSISSCMYVVMITPFLFICLVLSLWNLVTFISETIHINFFVRAHFQSLLSLLSLFSNILSRLSETWSLLSISISDCTYMYVRASSFSDTRTPTIVSKYRWK